MPKQSSDAPMNWREPAEQWIPKAIQARLTEIEALLNMLADVQGLAHRPPILVEEKHEPPKR